jgi:sugar phosphate isomerase/epimerase
MIKLSLQSLSYRDTFDSGTINLFGIIENAYQLKLDGIDIDHRHFESTDRRYLEQVRELCHKKGLQICYIGVSNNFGLTGVELDNQIKQMKYWIDVAASMGIRMVRAFGAWVPENENEDEVWTRMVEATREVVNYSESKNVVVGLHNHNHGCVPATGDQVMQLLKEINSPYYSHILDTGQYRGSPGVSEGKRGVDDNRWDFYESIRISVPKAVQVRAKIYRINSGKEKWLDYDRIMPIIKNAGFNGWMSVVYEGQDELNEIEAVPKASKYLRDMLNTYGL